jgi:ABC-type antimicrobial peptide transport system permease subunit
MNDSQSTDDASGSSWPDRRRAAISAGIVYFAFLLVAGVAFGAVSEVWLKPEIGDAAALAIEITLLFPAAWIVTGKVGRRFGIDSAWPMGATVAITAVVLLCAADMMFLAVIDPGVAKAILNHGWAEARFVAQIFLAALPLIYRGR